MNEASLTSVLAQINAKAELDSSTLSTMSDEDTEIVRLLAKCASQPVHPVFSRDRWIDLSDADYVHVAPALVLASRILEYSQTTQFIATLLDAPKTATGSHCEDPMRPVFLGQPLQRIALPRGMIFPEIITPLSFAQSSRARIALSDLSKVITMTFRKDRAWAYGMTLPTSTANDTGHPGTGSSIELTLEFLKRSNPLTSQSWDLLSNWLMLAVTLVHELMHAFHGHNCPENTPEPFFDDQNFAELGHAMENFLFGGSFVDYLKVVPEGAVKGLGFNVPVDADLVATRSVLGAVTQSWLRKVFTDEFWAQKLAASGALIPDKVVVGEQNRSILIAREYYNNNW